MTEAQGGDAFEKWQNACAEVRFQEAEYEKIVNKETKTAQKKLEKINNLKVSIPELDKNKDDINLSDTALSTLIDIYGDAVYRRRNEINNKYLEKGNRREEDLITLLSRVLKIYFMKNTTRLNNEYVTGEPDLFIGKVIYEADETYDTKSSYSLPTFLHSKWKNKLNKKINPTYYWQGQGYMWLTGARKHTICYCLVNGIAQAITEEKKRSFFYVETMFDQLDEFKRRDIYLAKSMKIEQNNIFDLEAFRKENPYFEFDNDLAVWKPNIPMHERVYTITIERNDEDIERLRQRIILCRRFMDKHFFEVPTEIFDVKKPEQTTIVDIPKAEAPIQVPIIQQEPLPAAVTTKKVLPIGKQIDLLERMLKGNTLSEASRKDAEYKLKTLKQKALSIDITKTEFSTT